jgi:hypothetical protein
MATAELFRARVTQLLSTAGNGSEQSVAKRMWKKYASMTAVEYSYEISDGFGFAECLYYVPNAIEYMREMRDDYGRVVATVVHFTRTWRSELERANLYPVLVDELLTTFRKWTGAFVPTTTIARDDRGGIVPGTGPFVISAIDLFLDELLAADLPVDHSTVFQLIFDEWTQHGLRVESSAAFLDFALRVRCVPGFERLYRSSAVLRTVFNSNLIRDHWERSLEYLQMTCTAEYFHTIKEVLVPS